MLYNILVCAIAVVSTIMGFTIKITDHTILIYIIPVFLVFTRIYLCSSLFAVDVPIKAVLGTEGALCMLPILLHIVSVLLGDKELNVVGLVLVLVSQLIFISLIIHNILFNVYARVTVEYDNEER